MTSPPRRGAPARPVTDATPPDGAKIDVASRTGWVLRMARVLSPGSTTMEDVARIGGVSHALVQRCETGRARSGRVTDAFEVALGLQTGALRAVVDQQCRWYENSPPDRDPAPPTPCPEELSALLERVRQPDAAGSDWLRWARTMSVAQATGLPLDLFAEVADELVRQLSLSVGSSYTTRFEALSLLRSGPYGEAVLARVIAHVARPGTQVLLDLASAMGARWSPAGQSWALSLLHSPETAMGGAVCVEEMALSVARDGQGGEFWTSMLPPLVELLNAHPDLGPHRAWVAHCVRLAPVEQVRNCPVRPEAPLPSVVDVEGHPQDVRNRHLAECRGLAAEVSEALGLGPEPMLARLVYDIVFSPHLARSVNSCLLLHAVPRMAEQVQDRIALLAESHPSQVSRIRAARRVNSLIHGPAPAVTERWLRHEDPALRAAGLRCAGTGGHLVEESALRAALADGLGEEAMYAAGMNGSPVLAVWAQDPSLTPELRAAAAWWTGMGTRVVDPHP